jgi:hypothetical protein
MKLTLVTEPSASEAVALNAVILDVDNPTGGLDTETLGAFPITAATTTEIEFVSFT